MTQELPMTKEAYKKGQEVVKRIWGQQTEEIFDVISVGEDTFDIDVIAWAFGYVFSRPPLDLKIRSLINVGIMTALGRKSILRTWIIGAFNAGCGFEEIREAVIQASLYGGFAETVGGLRLLKEVKEELFDGKEGQKLQDIYSIYEVPTAKPTKNGKKSGEKK